MAEQSVQRMLFLDLFAKPLVAQLDTSQLSSDGGAILLKAIDERLGFTARLAARLFEWRQVGKVAHDLPTLVRQRSFGIACRYPDANVAARLKDDPIHKLLVGRDPVAGDPLASRPTLSRFENAIPTRERVRLTHALADTVIAHRRVRWNPAHVRRLHPIWRQRIVSMIDSHWTGERRASPWTRLRRACGPARCREQETNR